MKVIYISEYLYILIKTTLKKIQKIMVCKSELTIKQKFQII